jgi:Na+/H+-dicarboxylate symporter
MGWYFGTVLTGLLIHGFIVVPLIFALVTRRLPFKFLGNMTQAIATAFGTASR